MNTKNIHIILVLMTFAMVGCSDKKDSSSSCLNQLNEEKYQQVAENSNCSNYHRGSAYLGMAGMSFSNFLKKGASDNLTKTLGIQSLDNASHYSAGNRDYITKALCLVGSDNFTSSSRCSGYEKRSGSRTNYDMEISLFGLIGDMIYVNYGILDANLDGTISTTETNNFSALSTSSVGNDGTGTTLDSDSFTWEAITSSTRYIYNDNLSYCLEFSDNFTVRPSSSNTKNYNSILKIDEDCPNYLSSITDLRPIIKLDNMTDITGDNSTALQDKITMVSELSLISTNLNLELGNIGLEDNSSLRSSLTEGLQKLDNGGTSDNGSVCTPAQALDVVYLLVKDAADNSSLSNSTDLHNKNLISLTNLTSSVNSGFDTSEIDSFSAAVGVDVTNVRLIYADNESGGSYTDSFEAAHSKLYKAIKNTRSLGTETSSKGDGKVIFRELICIAEN